MPSIVIDPTDVRQRFDIDTAELPLARPWGHFDTDHGPEVERDNDDAPHWFTDAHAVLLHRIECGCLCPENKDRTDFYGGRTQMPFPTFSATAQDLDRIDSGQP